MNPVGAIGIFTVRVTDFVPVADAAVQVAGGVEGRLSAPSAVTADIAKLYFPMTPAVHVAVVRLPPVRLMAVSEPPEGFVI